MPCTTSSISLTPDGGTSTHCPSTNVPAARDSPWIDRRRRRAIGIPTASATPTQSASIPASSHSEARSGRSTAAAGTATSTVHAESADRLTPA